MNAALYCGYDENRSLLLSKKPSSHAEQSMTASVESPLNALEFNEYFRMGNLAELPIRRILSIASGSSAAW